MTVAEKIKRSTKPLSALRAYLCICQSVKKKTLLFSRDVGCGQFQFIDGSKLTCRVYW